MRNKDFSLTALLLSSTIAGAPTYRSMTPRHRTPAAQALTVPNRLLEREPELAQQFSAFREQVHDILTDEVAAHYLHSRGLPILPSRHEMADVKATAVILRMLAKPSWGEYDLTVFNAFGMQALSFDLFADEFEAERHRIQQCVQEARSELLSQDQTLWP